METHDEDIGLDKAEALAHEAAEKLFNAIKAHLFGPDRFDISYLAKEAIVTAYREGLQHGANIYKWSSAPPTSNDPLTIK